MVEVNDFADATLADGTRGRDVDLNELVRVADFRSLTTGRPFLFNSAQADPTPFVTVAREGETIGFRFAWPSNETQLRFYGPKDVPVGIDYWDAATKTWDPVLDVTTTSVASHLLTETKDDKPRHVAEIAHAASRSGTYRIEVGRGGFLATLGSLGYDVAANEFSERTPHTYLSRASGLTQDPVYIYVPKGTRSLDLEVWDSYNRKQVQLYRGFRKTDVCCHGRSTSEPRHSPRPAETGRNRHAGPDQRQRLRLPAALLRAELLGQVPRRTRHPPSDRQSRRPVNCGVTSRSQEQFWLCGNWVGNKQPFTVWCLVNPHWPDCLPGSATIRRVSLCLPPDFRR